MTISSLSASVSAYGIGSQLHAKPPGQNPPEIRGPDSAKLSKLGDFISDLQELQSSDPDKFKAITLAISTQLQDAADAAAEGGDTRQAEVLSELASKFKTASETGTMPDLKPPGGVRGGGGPPPLMSSTDIQSDDEANTASATYELVAKLGSSNDPMSILTGILDRLF